MESLGPNINSFEANSMNFGYFVQHTDTDPNTGKNRSCPIFRYSSEFRYFSCS